MINKIELTLTHLLILRYIKEKKQKKKKKKKFLIFL